MVEGKSSSGMILLDRLRLVGEELAPREAFADLSKEDLAIWLTEPDPDKFPPHMRLLRDYLEQLSTEE